MKRSHILSCPRLVLLLILSLATYGTPQPVNAETDPQRGYNPLFVNVLPEDLQKTLCVGQRVDLEYLVYYMPGKVAPPLKPSGKPIPAKVVLSANKGTVSPPERSHNAMIGKVFRGNFSYTAGSEKGSDTILIKAFMGGYETSFPLTLEIRLCKASLQFNQQWEMGGVMNTYSGSGSLSVNKDGQVSGSGSQAVWSDIQYSGDGASCMISPPWEGSSGITFSGQMDDNGNSQVNMNLEALSVNATTYICTADGQSSSIGWPGYTFSACQILLAEFNFEAATLEVPFNCPGQEPFSLPITIIPRRES